MTPSVEQHPLDPKCGTDRRVLLLLHRFPYPLIGGDRVKAYHLLRHLSQISTLDVIALDEARSVDQVGLRHLETMCSTMTVVPFNRLEAALNVLGGIASRTPLEFCYYSSRAMQRSIDDAIARTRYDLVICFFLRTAKYVEAYGHLPKLLIAEDARVTLQERSVATFELSPQYIVRKIDALRLKSYEPEASSKFDLATYVAEEDRQRIQAAAPRLRTGIITNGVDLGRFVFGEGARKPILLFAGHLGVYHNQLMATRLLKELYPELKKRYPTLRVRIVGKSPGNALTRLVAETAGAELLADVPSMVPHLHECAVFVHAQTVGAGIQNKLLEAMACGIPVVTTEIGAEGIAGLEPGVHALLGGSNKELVLHCSTILETPDAARALSCNARQLIEERYTWDVVNAQLDHAIETVVPDFFDSFATRPARPHQSQPKTSLVEL